MNRETTRLKTVESLYEDDLYGREMILNRCQFYDGKTTCSRTFSFYRHSNVCLTCRAFHESYLRGQISIEQLQNRFKTSVSA